MNRAGRRFFLILSHAGMAVALFLVGVAYKMEWSSSTIIVLVMFYLACFSIGVGPLPWLVCSEIFPSQCRDLAMSIATVVNWASAFGVTASMGALENLVNAYGVFWFYAIVCVIGGIFVHIMLPETKGKSLEQIEQEFQDMYEKDLEEFD